MPLRCSVFIAVSLDGFIARKDGSIDWLDKANLTVPSGEDFGYHAFFGTVDALVMGRGTFDTVIDFPEWFYKDKPVIVLSRTMAALPAAAPATVSLSRETPAELVERLAKEGMTRLYIDGGLTIQSFLAAGLIDDFTITTIPVVIGSGRPLFSDSGTERWLEHVSTQAYPCGFVQSRYRVVRPS